MRTLARPGPLVAAFWLGWLAPDVGAQPIDGAEIFRRNSAGVAKVEVLRRGSTAPSAVGTAFFVHETGLLATNYHVMNDVVYEPDRWELRVVLAGGRTVAAVVAAVAAPHDLGLLKVDETPERVFAIRDGPPEQGARLFSLGHPADLAQSVVEGTFNGAVEHRVAPRYHLTGSLNPGMSGGPTLAVDGGVVGVNVSTAGNQLSFLIPGSEVRALLDGHLEGGVDFAPTLEAIEGQFARFQDAFLEGLFAAALPTETMGPIEVPSGPASAFDCSARAVDDEDELYDGRRYDCQTGDYVLVTQDLSFELMAMSHIMLESTGLGPLRFHTLYTQFFNNLTDWLFEETEDTTDYACERANVRAAGATLRVAFCARTNERMPSLHDVFVRTAVLGRDSVGVSSTLNIAAVRLESARRFVARYLDGFRWVG